MWMLFWVARLPHKPPGALWQQAAGFCSWCGAGLMVWPRRFLETQRFMNGVLTFTCMPSKAWAAVYLQPLPQELTPHHARQHVMTCPALLRRHLSGKHGSRATEHACCRSSLTVASLPALGRDARTSPAAQPAPCKLTCCSWYTDAAEDKAVLCTCPATRPAVLHHGCRSRP